MAEHQQNVPLIVNPMKYVFREYVVVLQNV
jgi:hypothetical protein